MKERTELISMSERIEMLRIAKAKLKGAKMQMEDVATEAAEVDHVGADDVDEEL